MESPLYIFGKRLKALREQKGISQKDFAKKINAKNTTVSNWENGLSRPDVDTVALICRALDVSADELLDIQLSDNDFSELEKRIIFQYRANPELQQAVRIVLGLEPSPFNKKA